jgi:hypothetical protein
MEQEPQPSDGSLDRANVGYTTLYCANPPCPLWLKSRHSRMSE